METRLYQSQQKIAIDNFIFDEKGNGIVNSVGASGKSHLIAWAAEKIHSVGMHPLIVTSRSKLLLQNESKLANPELAGVISAGLKREEYGKPITIGGIQTIYNKIDKLGHIDWLLVDECDEICNDKESESRYWQLIRAFPNARILGFTGSPFRMKDGELSWGRIISEVTYKDLITSDAEGKTYLTPLTNKWLDAPNLENVAIGVSGDYQIDELDKLMNVPELVKTSCSKLLHYARDRKKGLIFATSKKHAEYITGTLNMMFNENAAYVHSDIVEWQRQEIYNEFQHGDIRWLVNVDLLTVGIDFPAVDCLAFMRPTKSLRLWWQMLFRGIRLFYGKLDCLVLDFAGNLKEHGGLDNATWKYLGAKKVKTNRSQLKPCPSCESAIPLNSKFCPICNYEMLVSQAEIDHYEHADLETDINATLTAEKWYKPHMILFSEHTAKNTGNKSFKVEYIFGKNNSSVFQFIPFGGQKMWERIRAREWCKSWNLSDIPESIEEALKLCNDWKKPISICTMPQKNAPKYREIVGLEWE